jgi:predicted DNA-binding transcriptional regulator AlpA
VPVRLLSKHEVRAIAGVSFPVIWKWMRQGTFPRSRIVGGKSMWISTEIEAWLANLPVRPLKGDVKAGEVSRMSDASTTPTDTVTGGRGT